MKKKIYCLIFCLLFFCLAKNVIAGTIISGTLKAVSPNLPIGGKTNLFITEILPNPDFSQGGDEFIEIYNPNDFAVSLFGYYLNDDSTKIYKLDDYIIKAKKYLVVWRSQSKIILNIGGDSAKLYYQNNNNLIDQINYVNAPKNQSYIKIGENWQWTELPTPGQANILKPEIKIEQEKEAEKQNKDEKISNSEEKIEQTDIKNYLPNSIIINEIMPNPAGSQSEEWIELYNTLDEDISLFNWQLDDEEGGSKPFILGIDHIIEAEGYLVIHRQESKLILNNDRDSVRLFSPAGELINQIDYEKTHRGLALARGENDKFFWTLVPTPGEKNIIKLNDEEKELIVINEESDLFINSNEADFMEGAVITVTGTVTALPGTIGAQFFYISEPPAMQIYNFKKDFPDLEVGDFISVQGEFGFNNGQRRIKTNSQEQIALLKKTGQVSPIIISCEQLNLFLLGELVQVQGQITKKQSTALHLDDGKKEIVIFLRANNNIDRKKINVGDFFQITGIVTANKNELRIVPRNDADLVILNNKEEIEADNSSIKNLAENKKINLLNEEEEKKESKKYYYIVLGISLFLLGIGIYFKNKNHQP